MFARAIVGDALSVVHQITGEEHPPSAAPGTSSSRRTPPWHPAIITAADAGVLAIASYAFYAEMTAIATSVKPKISAGEVYLVARC
ncbi:hypothetical protein [Plantactinospora sp. CA-290183]|uniref:hypothetical protein n=1 Tax=Plantactinospora sp. CA-290183 TaxID=3240006 RepID=UPI003D924286